MATTPRSSGLGVVGCTALEKFAEMISLLKQSIIDKADWDRLCAVPLTSDAQMCQGLGGSAAVAGRPTVQTESVGAV